MNYSISINQAAIVENNLPVDLMDAAIFDLFAGFYGSPRAKTLTEGDIRYIQFKWNFILQRLPILGLTSRRSVFYRLERLCKAGLIERHPDNGITGDSWFCPGEKYDLMFRKLPIPIADPVPETPEPDPQTSAENCTGGVQNFAQGCATDCTGGVQEIAHCNKVDAITINAITTDANNTPLPPKGGNPAPEGDESKSPLKDSKEEEKKSAAQKKEEESKARVEADATAVLQYLNDKAGREFKLIESNKRWIRARLNEGFTADDLRRVVDFKVSRWKGDAKMSGFLRPETLFGQKFDSYLQDAKAAGDLSKARLPGEREIAWLTRIGAYDTIKNN